MNAPLPALCVACGDAPATCEIAGDRLCGACALDAVGEHESEPLELDSERPDYAPDGQRRW